ncbi:transglutaminase domain-containing protein, partial [Nocardioides hankookensis]
WLVVRGMRQQAGAIPVRGGNTGRLVRVVTAAAVLLTGLGIGTWVTSGRPPSAGTALRGQIETVPDLSQLDSPLRRFRTFTKQSETGSDNVHDKVLLTVTGAPAGALLRFVTLDSYDGDQWVPANDTIADTSDDSFLRMDSEVDNPTVGTPAQVQVAISKNYRSVWIPTYGSLTSLHFLLGESQARRDQVRYDLPTSTALLAGEVGDDDDYEFTSIVPDDRLTKRMRPWRDGIMHVAGIRRVDPLVRPVLASPASRMEKLFVMAHYLRDVGRFSSGGEPGESMYTSGHDLKRLTKGFLLAPRPVGDDEQYAAAMAIIANRLGIPARVVVGAVVPPGGKVRGRNVHTWVEVRISDGSWRTLYTDEFMGDKPPQPQMEPADPPTTGTVKNPPRQEEVTPTEVKVRDQLEEQDEAARRGSAVRWAPWLLLLLLVLVVPLVKLLVRGRRRLLGRPSQRLAGAWEDLVSQARDLGVPVRS